MSWNKNIYFGNHSNVTLLRLALHSIPITVCFQHYIAMYIVFIHILRLRFFQVGINTTDHLQFMKLHESQISDTSTGIYVTHYYNNSNE